MTFEHLMAPQESLSTSKLTKTGQ